MSTRGKIRILDENDNVMVEIYNHYDSYPSCLGVELARCIKDFNIPKGVEDGRWQINGHANNGYDDLMMLVIMSLKYNHGAGGVYLQPIENEPLPRDSWSEYAYVIKPPESIKDDPNTKDEPSITIYSCCDEEGKTYTCDEILREFGEEPS